jgi:hypothetical protein
MSSTASNIAHTLRRLLSEDELRSVESDPVLTQRIADFIRDYLTTHSVPKATPWEQSKQDALRGYYDEGPSDHKFDENITAPWTEVLMYDVATLFGRYSQDSPDRPKIRSIVPILHREGVHSIRDLLLLRVSYLEEFRGLGAARIETIVEYLAIHGLRLTDRRDLKDGRWLGRYSLFSDGGGTQTLADVTLEDDQFSYLRQYDLPFESYSNFPAADYLPGMHRSMRRDVKVGDLVEFPPDKVVVLRAYTRKYSPEVIELENLKNVFEKLGFRVEVK